MEHRSRRFLVACLISFNIVTLATPAAFPQAEGELRHRSALTALSPSNAFSIAQSPAPSPSPSPAAPSSPTLPEWAWWLLLAFIPIALLSGVFYGLQQMSRRQKPIKRQEARSVQLNKPNGNLPQRSELGNHGNQNDLTVSETTRLSRVDIVNELIHDLHSPDSTKRRKAIWELGQRGDSRAVQPLVDLLMDSDSQQRSLILAAVSEIGIRTLKPMNRALLMSVQDDSSEVRKNAIRDVTRVFDLVTQMSQLLQYATSDEDQEVQETAEWALAQLNRIRSIPGTEGLPSLGDRDASQLDAASEPRTEE